jgi:polar amino acid transport system substrate-binding protein
MLTRRLFAAAGLVATFTAAGCAHAPAGALPDVRAALAPTGALRVAVYPGSPSSLVVAKNGERSGVAYELGAVAAKRLGVPVEYVELRRAAEVFDAVKGGKADLTFTNASEVRQREADFTPPLVRLESGYLVAAGSRITDMARVDQPGTRVGVAEGGTSHATLMRELKQAQVVPVASLGAAAQMLRSGGIDAFASNKAILFELSDQVPGAQVLPGRWSVENLALATPKGRPPVAMDWLRSFGASLRGSAELQSMITRAGLRGTVPD